MTPEQALMIYAVGVVATAIVGGMIDDNTNGSIRMSFLWPAYWGIVLVLLFHRLGAHLNNVTPENSHD